MKMSARELSGRRLHRFFARFLRAEVNLSRAEARHLAFTLATNVVTIRVRQEGLVASGTWSRKDHRNLRRLDRDAAAAPPAVEAKAEEPQQEHVADDETKFDPYAFGLVPVFVREGPEGLMQRLKTIDRLDHLRKLARAQQIALPAELRSGEETAAGDVRLAIVAAVRKRIAGRRAAAG